MNTPSEPTFRCTFTLPRTLALDISHLAKSLRVSQSALLANLLTEPIAQLRTLADVLPRAPASKVGPDVVRRLRGDSAVLVNRAISDAVELAESLRDQK